MAVTTTFDECGIIAATTTFDECGFMAVTTTFDKCSFMATTVTLDKFSFMDTTTTFDNVVSWLWLQPSLPGFTDKPHPLAVLWKTMTTNGFMGGPKTHCRIVPPISSCPASIRLALRLFVRSCTPENLPLLPLVLICHSSIGMSLILHQLVLLHHFLPHTQHLTSLDCAKDIRWDLSVALVGFSVLLLLTLLSQLFLFYHNRQAYEFQVHYARLR